MPRYNIVFSLSPCYRASRRSTFFRLLPTFLTAFFTAGFDRRDFRASYRTS